jgi:hypothetical protein
MSAASNEFEKKILNCALRQVNITAPTTPFLALFTVAPNNDGTGGTEVAGGSYAAIDLLGKFGAAAAGDPASIASTVLIQSPVATANWGTVVAYGVYNHVTNRAASDCWLRGNLNTPQTINSGGRFELAVGDAVFNAS